MDDPERRIFLALGVCHFGGKGGETRFCYRGRVTSELMFQLRHCVRFKQVVRSRRGHFYVILCHFVSMLLDASCGKGYLVRRLHVAVVGRGGGSLDYCHYAFSMSKYKSH